MKVCATQEEPSGVTYGLPVRERAMARKLDGSHIVRNKCNDTIPYLLWQLPEVDGLGVFRPLPLDVDNIQRF